MTYILPFISISLILALLLEPSLSIEAAKSGLLLWFNTLLPSLLPFIIASNMLMESGCIKFFAKLFRPIMYPLFKLPSCCAFPWVMGLISGYPMGAKLASNLWQDKLINDIQLQRLMSFSNNAGPFFILGAVGTGMLNNPMYGYLLLKIHFMSSIIVGFIFSFYGNNLHIDLNKQINAPLTSKSLGQVLGDSISDSMETIVHIGGYIIFFSVIVSLIKESCLVRLLAKGIYTTFNKLDITTNLATSWVLGLVEMSNGINLISSSSDPNILKLATISFILGWGGLSVHAQSLHFLKNTQIKTPLYLLSKFLHGVIAFILTFILF